MELLDFHNTYQNIICCSFKMLWPFRLQLIKNTWKLIKHKQRPWQCILTDLCVCILWSLCNTLKPENTNSRERLSTVDLLIKVSDLNWWLIVLSLLPAQITDKNICLPIPSSKTRQSAIIYSKLYTTKGTELTPPPAHTHAVAERHKFWTTQRMSLVYIFYVCTLNNLCHRFL